MKNLHVCFFDSGIGGISLLYDCVCKLPNVDFTYFADNDNVPYGSLSHDKILKLTLRRFDEIRERNPSAAVVACNTVTAQCIDYLRNKYPFEIVGIQPAIKPAAEIGRTLVLATPSTAHSSSLLTLQNKYGMGRTYVEACKNLAEYIEKNIFDISEDEIISRLPKADCDAVVLGCTHYIFVKEIIRNFYSCPIFDGIDGTSERLCHILGLNDSKAPRSQKIDFVDGDSAKNRLIFDFLMVKNGGLSQKIE